MSSSLNGIFSSCKSKVDDESWVQNPPAACVTHQLNKIKKKAPPEDIHNDLSCIWKMAATNK